ncbi:hypothetical protein IKD56_00810 [bacterium]|nr:hypothetical protein [bacterium]
MVITPQTNLKLLKLDLEIDEKNQLTFPSLASQTAYFQSLAGLSEDNFTYQRKDGIIRFPANIDSIITYNYVMYQNEQYGNKWFYAFIEDMRYLNNDVTEIKIKTDVFQTWQFDFEIKKSFIERETVSDDTVGKHTVPENLETGEFICNIHEKDTFMDTYAEDLCFIVASTSEPISGTASQTPAPSGVFNGVYTALMYYRYDVTTAIDTILEIMANNGKTDSINSIFMAPKWLAPLDDDPQVIQRQVAQSSTPAQYDVSVTKQTTLNGYAPKNNKLLCYPYNYLLLSNNIGQNEVLHYEKFSTNVCNFTVKGVLAPGCQINITPNYYNGISPNTNESLSLGKFTICNFLNDAYKNWLAQNSLNILGQTVTVDDVGIFNSALNGIASSIVAVSSGNAFAGGLSILSGIEGVMDSVLAKQVHEMIPSNVRGQLSGADLNVASGNNTFHFYKMSIKQEYAKIIDEFFSMYGYKVNETKVPNLNSRVNWNFIKTKLVNIIGDVPQKDMEELKQMFNNGITLWHNPLTFLDYSQSNNIV